VPSRSKHDTGFNRKVHLEWLEKTLRMAASGIAFGEIEESLKEDIARENQGKETIRKVFVHLNRVWLQPPRYCVALRDSAFSMFRDRPESECAFLLSWGMCLAAYPFIAHVAEATGRLLRLQGSAQASQINTRILEQFGDRHFIHRSVRYNLSMFLDSGVLKESAKRGIYTRGRIVRPRDNKTLSWLVEALLHSQDDTSMPVQQIAAHGALFPFDLDQLTLQTVTVNPRLQVLRHSLRDTLVTLS